MIERDKARVARERGGERRRERGGEIITFWQRMEHIACGRGPSAASLRGVASCSLACLSGLSADRGRQHHAPRVQLAHHPIQMVREIGKRVTGVGRARREKEGGDKREREKERWEKEGEERNRGRERGRGREGEG